MSDSFRSFTILAISSAAVAMLTVGLAGLLVPGRAAGPQRADGAAAEPTASVTRPDGGIGGTLTVTGDREGAFRLTSESIESQYSLVGDDGRLSLSGPPAEIVQISYEGWEFFPDPEDCTIEAGEHDQEIGVVVANVACTELTDVRDNGTLTFAGTIGLPADLLGMRGDLPETGGTVTVGDRTLTFTEALLAPFPQFGAGHNMELVDEDAGAVLGFTYDRQTHALGLAHVALDGAEETVPGDACSIATHELGRLNPRAAVVELSIDCPEVDVPGMGAVPIVGTLIVVQVESPR